MAQILDPIPAGQRKSILCCYVNATSHIQIARVTNIAHWYFERVVFPGQRLIFEALPDALLEIHTGMMASAILSDTIPCQRLSIGDSEDDGGDEEIASQPPSVPATAHPIAGLEAAYGSLTDSLSPLKSVLVALI